jgi:hypothetical protein
MSAGEHKQALQFAVGYRVQLGLAQPLGFVEPSVKVVYSITPERMVGGIDNPPENRTR